MPQFRHWSKNALSRLTYYMPKQETRRNQVLFKEGDPCTHIFVVVEGEFEITKWVRPQRNMENDQLHFYIGPIRAKIESTRRFDEHMPKRPNNFLQRIAVVGPGNMIGEDDAVNE